MFKGYDLDAVSSDVKDMIAHLPIHVENKIRTNMLSSIFFSYGKRLIDQGKSLNEVKDILTKQMDIFTEKQGTFCNGNYHTKTIERVIEYAQTKSAIPMEVINNFLKYSSDSLAKYVTDDDILQDLTAAHESLHIRDDKHLYTLQFAMEYLDKCVKAVNEVCDMDAGFIQSLQ